MQSCFSTAFSRGAVWGTRFAPWRTRNRCFGTLATGIPLTQELPGTPPINPISSPDKYKTLITTLDNGMRIASQDIYGQASCFSVYVDTGVKYETDEVHGIAHLFERLTFKSTQRRSAKQLVSDLEDIGGNILCSSSREVMMYTGECIRPSVPRLVEILSDALLRPKLDPEEIQEQKEYIAFEINEFLKKPDTFLQEILHELAFRDQPLGRTMIIPQDRLLRLDRTVAQAWHNTFYRPNRMIVAASGIDHAELVGLVKQNFVFNSTSSSPSSSASISLRTSVPRSIYKGGELRLDYDQLIAEGQLPPKDPAHKKDLNHLLMFFEGTTLSHADMYPMAVLHSLLGGGGSFSSGGPGKGMYSRLYRKVLVGNPFVEQATSFNTAYCDGGLFGVYVAVDQGTFKHATLAVQEMLAKELLSVAMHIEEEELERAKNQLKSMIFTQLESRNVIADDIGRQLMAYGHREEAEETCRKIDRLKAEDLQAVLKKSLLSAPTILLLGKDIDSIATQAQVAGYLKQNIK